MGRVKDAVNVGDEDFGRSSPKNPGDGLPLLSLNHVSFVCKSVIRSVKFYEEVLGFILIKRPSSFNFKGAWLFNHGIGIHLLECETLASPKLPINPKDNHISFQCSNMELLIHRLERMKIEYVKAVVEEGGIIVDQIFFHDPDGYMIEICNCNNLPVLPLSSIPITKITKMTDTAGEIAPSNGKRKCSGEVEAKMMENLAVDMMNLYM